jgi:hypothetical protein
MPHALGVWTGDMRKVRNDRTNPIRQDLQGGHCPPIHYDQPNAPPPRRAVPSRKTNKKKRLSSKLVASSRCARSRKDHPGSDLHQVASQKDLRLGILSAVARPVRAKRVGDGRQGEPRVYLRTDTQRPEPVLNRPPSSVWAPTQFQDHQLFARRTKKDTKRTQISTLALSKTRFPSQKRTQERTRTHTNEPKPAQERTQSNPPPHVAQPPPAGEDVAQTVGLAWTPPSRHGTCTGGQVTGRTRPQMRPFSRSTPGNR